MVFKGQEERAGGCADDVVGWNVGVLPRLKFDVIQDRISFLTR